MCLIGLEEMHLLYKENTMKTAEMKKYIYNKIKKKQRDGNVF